MPLPDKGNIKWKLSARPAHLECHKPVYLKCFPFFFLNYVH